MSQHTPGPWQWLDYSGGRKLLTATNRAVIHCPDAPINVTEADKSLLAAAPDLLVALEERVADFWDWMTPEFRGMFRANAGMKDHWIFRAEAVVAKAKGQA